MSRREMMFFVAGVALTTAFTGLFFAASHAETNTASVAHTGAAAPVAAASATFDANTVRTAQLISNSSSANAGSLDDVTERLATRLASNGGSDADWRLLAESYDYMGKLQEAADARSHIAIASVTAQASRTQ